MKIQKTATLLIFCLFMPITNAYGVWGTKRALACYFAWGLYKKISIKPSKPVVIPKYSFTKSLHRDVLDIKFGLQTAGNLLGRAFILSMTESPLGQKIGRFIQKHALLCTTTPFILLIGALLYQSFYKQDPEYRDVTISFSGVTVLISLYWHLLRYEQFRYKYGIPLDAQSIIN